VAHNLLKIQLSIGIDMKATYLVPVFIIFFISSCEKSELKISEHDSINLSLVKLDTFIINNYYIDAKLLYAYEIFQDSSHFNRNNPIIDTSEITKVLKIIQTIYDIKSPITNTVFNYYKIHARICISFNSIYLKVKTDQSEIRNLSNGVIPTGNQQLDILLLTYDFDSIKTSYSYPNFPWLTIYSNNEYNLIPIVEKFNKIPSIIMTDMEKGLCFGDGNTISMARYKDYAQVVFSIGDGDCPAGCIYHKYWEFHVKDNSAKFIKTYED
jgi:hypothetical protein